MGKALGPKGASLHREYGVRRTYDHLASRIRKDQVVAAQFLPAECMESCICLSLLHWPVLVGRNVSIDDMQC